MGSQFYSFEEAANRLGCSKRTIHNHVRHGYIRKAHRDGKVVLHREDVEQLANETGVDMPAFNKKNFYLLMARVQKLEQDMGLCRRILDVRDSPLRPSKNDALQLMAAASKALAANYWTDEEIDNWSTIFDRLDEVSFEMLSEHIETTHPYEIFFKLCLAQMRDVSKRTEFQTTLSLQLLHKKLDEGRKKLRATILMWMRITNGNIPEQVLQKMESDKGSLFQKLTSSPKTPRS